MMSGTASGATVPSRISRKPGPLVARTPRLNEARRRSASITRVEIPALAQEMANSLASVVFPFARDGRL